MSASRTTASRSGRHFALSGIARLVLLFTLGSGVIADRALASAARAELSSGRKCGADATVLMRTEPQGVLNHDLDDLKYTGGELIVTLSQADQETPCESPTAVTIEFPGSGAVVEPDRLIIEPGATDGHVRLAIDRPLETTLYPIVKGLRAQNFKLDPLRLKFVSPVYSVFVEAEEDNLVQGPFFPPTAKLRVRLVDKDQRNTTDRVGKMVVELVVEKGAGDQPIGSVNPRVLQFEALDEELEATYTPNETGKATIRGVASINGYPIGHKPAVIQFSYPFYDGPFLWLCVIASLAGAFLRGLEQRTLQHKYVALKQDGLRFAFCGVLGGIILFLVGRRLLRTEFSQALVAIGSRPLAAMYWGLLGGYLGPLVVIKKMKSL